MPHILMALINYFSCFLWVLNVIVTINPVAGTVRDVGGSCLCVTGGETEAAHPGDFPGSQGSLLLEGNYGFLGYLLWVSKEASLIQAELQT